MDEEDMGIAAGRKNMQQALEELAAEVANDQAAIDGQCEDTRKRVVRMGKALAKLQKVQKKDQEEAKRLGQPVVTWKEWVQAEKMARPSFPEHSQSIRYILIARHPKAYQPHMSIKEAYKEAGKWKKNGGDPPIVEKVTIKERPLITIGAAAGKLVSKIERLMQSDVEELAKENQWTDDEIDGATEELSMLREACADLLRRLKKLGVLT